MAMIEIDRRREVAKAAINRLRAEGSACPECGAQLPISNEVSADGVFEAERKVARAEAAVLEALREWWKQDCKEAP